MSKVDKKVAIVYTGAKSWGGIETYLELLFNNATKTKTELTLVSLGAWPLTEKIRLSGHRVELFSDIRINLVTILKISRYLKRNKFELIVSQGTVANAYARAASFFSNVPSLVTLHSDPFYDYPNSAIRFIYAVIEKLTRFPTKYYIAVSEYLQKMLLQTGINNTKICVVWNGVEDPLIESHVFSKDTVTIGSIGRLHGVKNYSELIFACASFKGANWKLKIVGEGNERQNLEILVSKLGLSEKIEFVGYVGDVYKELEDIDIYVQPSLSEGFGLTVVEAMLAGKPVIVSPFGSLPELVQNGKTGIVMKGTDSIDIAEAVNELLSDKEKARRLARDGQSFARTNFGIEKWVRETEKAYVGAAE